MSVYAKIRALQEHQAGSREAMDQNTRESDVPSVFQPYPGALWNCNRCPSMFETAAGASIHVSRHPGQRGLPPGLTPEEKWAWHLRREARIAERMRGYDAAASCFGAPTSFTQGHWEPSTSGLAGGFVGVWKKR